MPIWEYTLDVSDVFYHGDSDREPLFEAMLAVAQKVERYQNASWPVDDELELIADELLDAAKAKDIEWFNLVWDALYDWADDHHVWIKTWK